MKAEMWHLKSMNKIKAFNIEYRYHQDKVI